MAYINIAEWTAEHVSEWLAGLDDATQPYAHFFINNNIDGRHLLTLLPDDLIHLNIIKIGHQELILDAVDLLRQLHYTLTTETLQSLSLRVGCKARSLYNDLKRNGPQEENGKQERVSVSTLSSVSDLLVAVKVFVSWLDRYPFEGESQYSPVRRTVLKHSIELASTAQRDQFADKPHETIKNSCLNLAELCDKIIQEFNDSLIIQPASLDIVTVKRKPDEELGMHIHSSYNGVHIVGGLKFKSPSHRCGKVEIGDEIVQVNYQTVVGWQLKKLVSTMKEHPTELHLTLKKRPRHSNLLGQVIVLKPYRIPSRKTALARLHKWSESNPSIPDVFINTRRIAPIAIDEIEDDDDSAFLPDGVAIPRPIDQKLPSVHYPLLPVKTRATVQRRATVSGASPTVTRPPVSIEELVAGVPSLRKELVGRSISHDPSNRHHLTENGLMPRLKPIKSDEKGENGEVLNGKGTKEPVWPPASQEEESNILEYKSLMLLSRLKRQGASKNGPHLLQVKTAEGTPKIEGVLGERQQNTVNLANIKNVSAVSLRDQCTMKSTILPKQDRGSGKQILPQHSSSNSPDIISQKPFIKESERLSDIPSEKSPPKECSPVIRRKEGSSSPVKSCRRVSVKDLGNGDYQAWLYKRKEGKRLFSGPKWVKRWGVLKGTHLYIYTHKDDLKAECLVNLTGFIISPAPDCKAKKYAFKLFSTSISLLLATDNLTDMTIWMNKMSLVAISYPNYNKQPPICLLPAASEPLYSETEDESEESTRNDFNNSATSSPGSSCSSDSAFATSYLLPGRKASADIGSGPMAKSPSSFAQIESPSQAGSPRHPTGALKINYHKAVKATSPQRTVAERPLERMVTEGETRKASSKARMAPTSKPRGYLSAWPPEPPPGPPPPAYESSSLGRFPHLSSIGTSPSTIVVSQSTNGVDIGCQSPSSHSPHTPTGYAGKPKSQHELPPPPLHPRGVRPNVGQVLNIVQTNPPVIRPYRSATNMQRCASLQKLSSNEPWSEKPETPPSEFISVLDREYHRLYGKKKPETISPQSAEDQSESPDSTRSSGSWWNSNVPRTATSQQIHSLYTSQDTWKSPSDHESPSGNERPSSTSRSLSVSSDMNMSLSHIDKVGSRHCSPISRSSVIKESAKVGSSGYESGTQSPNIALSVSPCSSVDSNDTSSSKNSKFSLAKQFSPKSPSGSFRFFSSPKFVRKFTSPKQERKYSQGQLKLPKHIEEPPKLSRSPKHERKFLGSPKLARAIFRSPKQSSKVVTTTTTGVQTEHTFDELVRLHQQSNPALNLSRIPSKESIRSEDTSGTLSDKLLEVLEDRIKSSSNSSLNSNGSAVSSSGSSHFYVEARFRPQITISLPLVTEAGDDGGPRTPVKPTMGVSMLGKKRSPSTSSERTSSDTGRVGLGMDETLQEEDTKEWAERSEITMLINTQEESVETAISPAATSEVLHGIEEYDELGNLVETLRKLCLTPMGVDVHQRRHNTMLQPSQNKNTRDLVLALRAFQRTLSDRQTEATAIDELLSAPITSQRLEDWICCYPHLLPPDYC